MSDTITKIDIEKLFEFAKKAAHIGNILILDPHHLTPRNFEQEKEKFLQSENYNPKFTYYKKDLTGVVEEIHKLHRKLDDLEIPTDLSSYLKDYLNNLYRKHSTMQSIGSNDFAHHAKSLFYWDIDNIKKLRDKLPKVSPKTSHDKAKTALEIKKAFIRCLEEKYAISDYPIVIDSLNTHIIVDGQTRLKIGARVKRNPNNIRRLIVHEIETHVLQKRNIRKSENPLIKLAIYKDKMLYSEGLAVFNEFKTNTITKSAYDIYQARLTAVENLHKTFREIYDGLKKTISADKAYVTTYRVKRGLGNTNHPGGFPKDAVYLLGYLQIKALEESGENIEKLYLYQVPKLGKLLIKYHLLEIKDFLIPKFEFD